jgi:hypothetical protein
VSKKADFIQQMTPSARELFFREDYFRRRRALWHCPLAAFR